MESKSERKVKFDRWLDKVCPEGVSSCTPMPGDASFRQYYRITTTTQSYVAMDAPPPENCQPYVAVAAALRGMGLLAPEVFAADIDQGFLLLSDFGDTTYLQALKANSSTAFANELYVRALKALSVMQAGHDVASHKLQPFDREWLQREWVWHQEWFLQKWLGLPVDIHPALHACYEHLIVSALQQPQVFMHRDFHSANLMVVPENNVGILDFQDAFIGPLTYDAVSLLRDCYIDWPPQNVESWALYYADLLRESGMLPNVTDALFLQWFDWMGLQRHIKALMTFARKAVRDKEPRYLQYVPRTLNYITTVSGRYPALDALTDYYTNIVQPALRNAKPICVP